MRPYLSTANNTQKSTANNTRNKLGCSLSLMCYLFSLVLFTHHLPSVALEEDRSQPIEVSANQATLDDKKNLAVYEGNVVLTQGSLTIKADKLTIKAATNGQVDEVIATGDLAEFTQTPDPNKDPIIAKAEHITYSVAQEKIVLTRSASVIQNKNLFQGNVITYDFKQQKLSASGPSKIQSGEQPIGRVKMILPPPSASSEQEAKPVTGNALTQTTEITADTNEQIDSDSPSQELQK
ncbi:lipopolysaccharide transport periplasmic protein LptA [Gammaproteobacteria bacterium 42_54_T18]|nr:lipopolysaccharide transport periplasmic protein LptA [Gammaproteobacteria bacterium 42_54_T18]